MHLGLEFLQNVRSNDPNSPRDSESSYHTPHDDIESQSHSPRSDLDDESSTSSEAPHGGSLRIKGLRKALQKVRRFSRTDTSDSTSECPTDSSPRSSEPYYTPRDEEVDVESPPTTPHEAEPPLPLPPTTKDGSTRPSPLHRRTFRSRGKEKAPATPRTAAARQCTTVVTLAMRSEERSFGLVISEGLRVIEIDEDTPAARSGLRPLDLVVACDGQRTSARAPR